MEKNEIVPFAKMRVELEGIVLSEISQSEKDKYHMTSLMYGIWGTQQMHIGEGKEKKDKN